MSADSVGTDIDSDALGRMCDAVDLVAEEYGIDPEDLATATLSKVRRRGSGD